MLAGLVVNPSSCTRCARSPSWRRAATAIWLAASAWAIERTWRVWRSAAPTAVRMALLVTASVLVSPHLFAYDAAVLILPGLWLAAWLMRDAVAASRVGTRYWQTLPLLCVTFLVPTALFIKLQLSVLLLLWLHIGLARAGTAIAPPHRTSAPAPPH